jgi:hypothetical protein
MWCFKLNKTVYVCVGTVLLNVYIYLVFVGNGWLELVPSCLPYLRELFMWWCRKVCDKYVEELAAAVPDLKIVNSSPYY